MIGVAAHAGRTWTITDTALFIIMTILAFVKRAVTGLWEREGHPPQPRSV